MGEPIDANAWAAAITSLAIAAVIAVAIIVSLHKRRANLEVIKHAIERGQQLDEKTVRLLVGRAATRDQRKDLRLHGTIWVAIGIGFTLFSLIAYGTSNRVAIGVGVLGVFLGAGLLAASRVVSQSVPDGK
jgi:hypothetical protein